MCALGRFAYRYLALPNVSARRMWRPHSAFIRAQHLLITMPRWMTKPTFPPMRRPSSKISGSLSLRRPLPAASLPCEVFGQRQHRIAAPRSPRQIMTARAAALIPASDGYSSDLDNLLASMFTAGYDVQAARWSKFASGRALAMLAVGAPSPINSFDSGDVSGFDGATSNGRKLLFAGMAGLGRLDASSIESLANKLDVPIGRQSSWTRALDRAVAAKETGTVVLLCAAALQTYDWSTVKPEYFFRAITALRTAGLEGEARMIAAEAVARS